MGKIRLKKKFKKALIILVLVLVASIFGIKKYNEYKYKQTNEYKLTLKDYSIKEAKTIIDKLNSKMKHIL